MTKTQFPMIHLEFVTEVEGKKDYYFGSIRAMFTRFTAEQIGCTKGTLYAFGLEEDHPKTTPKAIIRKEYIFRQPQENKK